MRARSDISHRTPFRPGDTPDDGTELAAPRAQLLDRRDGDGGRFGCRGTGAGAAAFAEQETLRDLARCPIVFNPLSSQTTRTLRYQDHGVMSKLQGALKSDCCNFATKSKTRNLATSIS